MVRDLRVSVKQMNRELHFCQFPMNMWIYRWFFSCFLKSVPESLKGSKLNFCRMYEVHHCKFYFLKFCSFYSSVPPKYWSQGTILIPPYIINDYVMLLYYVNDFLKSKAWRFVLFTGPPPTLTNPERKRFSTDTHFLLYFRFSATQVLVLLLLLLFVFFMIQHF